MPKIGLFTQPFVGSDAGETGCAAYLRYRELNELVSISATQVNIKIFSLHIVLRLRNPTLAFFAFG